MNSLYLEDNVAPSDIPTTNNILRLIAELARKHLVPILEETLSLSSERHLLAKGKGADGFSFGTDAWSLPARMFKESVEEGTIPFGISTKWGCALTYGNIRIRHHRVGRTENDAIWKSFPRNTIAGAKESSHQLSLPFGDESTIDPQEESIFILAYMANATDGLCAVYVASIGQIRGGKVEKWEEVEEVWRRSNTEEQESSMSPKVPAEQIEIPKVRLEKKARKDVIR